MSESENSNSNHDREIDQLKYRGNDVPRFLRFAWTILLIFSVIYLVKFMLPELKLALDSL